jgi:hypothetical protein
MKQQTLKNRIFDWIIAYQLKLSKEGNIEHFFKAEHPEAIKEIFKILDEHFQKEQR